MQNADEQGSKGSSIAPPASADPNAAQPAEPRGRQRAGGAPHGRHWWSRFLQEFAAAHPEKQVAQIYYITAILAVIGSLGAAILTFGEHLWPERAALPAGPPTVATQAAGPSDAAAAPTLSIVVLPFANLSGDASQEYFADGVTDSLTTDLSRALPGSFVVARETAFTYQGKAQDARQIGRELHVRYILEGSVALAGDSIRVNARLVDAGAGNEIWAERFDTVRGDILRVQDEIVGRLSRSVGLRVIDVEARRSERDKASNPEAIDLVLRGEAQLNRPSSSTTLVAARGLFQQALALQADNVDALAGTATTYIFETLNGYYASGNDERLERAEPLLTRALAIDDHHIVALKAKAGLLRAKGDFEEAIAAAKMVIAQNPGEPWAYKEVGLSTMYLGRTGEALPWFENAESFGPRDPGQWTWLGGKGQALLLLGRDQEAIAVLRAALDSDPADVGDYAVLAAAYALSDRADEAKATLAQYRRVRPEVTVSTFRNLSPVPLALTDPSYRQQRERLKDGLRKAGMPD